ncbi:MAG: hypothetical protein JWQ98_146 [Chlorobi bacterium]|nr:hypothetical protein [Chlorobiota bacterium]
MSMFRRRRLTDGQLLSIFRSLPQAKAPADTEERLGRLIAQHSDHVPSVLGTLPWISAPADFDERLMEAIRDSRRPVTPIPPSSPVVGGPSPGWFTNIPGWVGGVIAAAGLLFFLNHSGDMVETEGASHTAPVPVSTGTAPKASAETPELTSPAPRVSPDDARIRTVSPSVVRGSGPVTGVQQPDINPVSVAPAHHQRASVEPPAELSVPTVTRTASITPAGAPPVDDSDGGIASQAKPTVPQIPTSQPESLGHAYPTRIDSVSEQHGSGAESGPNNGIIVDTGGGRKSQDSTRKNP